MPQEFHVLRCCSCDVFQVHQVKKSNKWSCKMCGQKQSIKKVYGQGSGADCRRHVQKLNMMKGQMQEASLVTELQTDEQPEDCHTLDIEEVMAVQSVVPPGPSRWHQFVEKQYDEDVVSDGEEAFTTDRRTFETARKKKRYEKRPAGRHGDGPKSKQRCVEQFTDSQDFKPALREHGSTNGSHDNIRHSVTTSDQLSCSSSKCDLDVKYSPTSKSTSEHIQPQNSANSSQFLSKFDNKHSFKRNQCSRECTVSVSRWTKYDQLNTVDEYSPVLNTKTCGGHKTLSVLDREFTVGASLGLQEQRDSRSQPYNDGLGSERSPLGPNQAISKPKAATVNTSSKWNKFMHIVASDDDTEEEDENIVNIKMSSTMPRQSSNCNEELYKPSSCKSDLNFQVDDDLDELLKGDF